MTVNDVVQYRRKREGRTNYKKRLSYLKSGKNRLVIRKSNKQIMLQIVGYEADGDKVICSVTSKALAAMGWKYSLNNTPACYLSGMLLAKSAKEHKIHEAIVDFGLQTNVPGSRLYAAVKGAIEGGLKIPADNSVFPNENRLKGEHIIKYSEEARNQQFAKYKTQNLDTKKMATEVDQIIRKLEKQN